MLILGHGVVGPNETIAAPDILDFNLTRHFFSVSLH